MQYIDIMFDRPSVCDGHFTVTDEWLSICILIYVIANGPVYISMENVYSWRLSSENLNQLAILNFLNIL